MAASTGAASGCRRASRAGRQAPARSASSVRRLPTCCRPPSTSLALPRALLTSACALLAVRAKKREAKKAAAAQEMQDAAAMMAELVLDGDINVPIAHLAEQAANAVGVLLAGAPPHHCPSMPRVPSSHASPPRGVCRR